MVFASSFDRLMRQLVIHSSRGFVLGNVARFASESFQPYTAKCLRRSAAAWYSGLSSGCPGVPVACRSRPPRRSSPECRRLRSARARSAAMCPLVRSVGLHPNSQRRSTHCFGEPGLKGSNPIREKGPPLKCERSPELPRNRNWDRLSVHDFVSLGSTRPRSTTLGRKE